MDDQTGLGWWNEQLACLKAGVQRRRRIWQGSKIPEDRDLLRLLRNALRG